ncbi:MAG: DUF2889 domain-containing protein [Spirochaetota bacterium]|nr:DUF2889 domain-containing protein [Spirochaetota bacterium]
MSLFERNKNIKADLIDKGLLRFEVSMLDNVHNITAIFHVTFPSREIKHAEVDFKRAPYVDVCSLVSKRIEHVIGLKIGKGFNNKVIETLGGKDGCHHLIDLTIEMAKGLSQFINRSKNFIINDYIDDASVIREKVYEVYPDAKNMCWAYNTDNDHLYSKKIKCGLRDELAI